MATAVNRIPIQDFVAQLRKFPEAAFDETEQLRKFLQDTPLNPDSLAPYLTWDRQHYTRNLIDKTPLYELVAICWEVGQASRIHNHRDQNCWMAVPIGRLKVQNYRVDDRDAQCSTCHLVPTRLFEMNPAHPGYVDPLEPVHEVLNLFEFAERAVSVHVYSRPFDTCEIYQRDKAQRDKSSYSDIPLFYTSEYGQLHPDARLI